MGILVPALRQKFKLLVAYGPYSSIDAIAERLGKRPKTILSWADGSPGADPDSVPDRNFANLVEVFAEAIGADADPEKVRELLFLPPSWLETALRQKSGQSFRALLDAEADQSSFRLYRATESSGQMIETDFAQSRDEDHRLKLGERFRLVLERDLRLFNVYALQYANAQWGPVPIKMDANSGHVHMPGFHADGSHAYMKERRDSGESLFAAVACRRELPEVLAAHAEEGTALDASSLNALADVLSKSARTERRLFSVSVVFEQV